MRAPTPRGLLLNSPGARQSLLAAPDCLHHRTGRPGRRLSPGRPAVGALQSQKEYEAAAPVDRSNSYEEQAAAFMRARNPGIGRDVVREWAQELPPRAPVLELGCGHGAISRVLIDAGLTDATGAGITLPCSANLVGWGMRLDLASAFPSELASASPSALAWVLVVQRAR